MLYADVCNYTGNVAHLKDIGIDINGDASKHKLIGGGSARSEPSNSNYTQLFVFFVIMVVVLNLAMWYVPTLKEHTSGRGEGGVSIYLIMRPRVTQILTYI